MANNRMWLRCSVCSEQFFLLKYYPSQGWYINRDEEKTRQFGADLNAWLDLHKHGSLFGSEVFAITEADSNETWQPIDTMPMDEGKRLVYWSKSLIGDEGVDMVSGWREYQEILSLGEPPATMWMPIPDPKQKTT